MNRNLLMGVGVALAVGVAVIVVSRGGRDSGAVTVSAPKSAEAMRLYDQASKLAKSRKPVEAKMIYQELLEQHPDAENIVQIQQELHQLNMDLLFSKQQVPEKTLIHAVEPGDTLGKIARRYNTTVEFLKKSNDLKSDTIRVGQKLRVWKGNFNIFVDKSQNILILKDGEEMLKVYTVSTGENNSTPVGTFTITSLLENPVWFNSGVIVPPESPQNVLGTRWLGFEEAPGYGIHGTIEPETIGRQVTAGCVRMLNDEVEELYSLIPRGTKVVIVD